MVKSSVQLSVRFKIGLGRKVQLLKSGESPQGTKAYKVPRQKGRKVSSRAQYTGGMQAGKVARRFMLGKKNNSGGSKVCWAVPKVRGHART